MSEACTRCPLPDCDIASKGCLLRRLAASRRNKLKAGRAEEVTDEERAAYNEVFDDWHRERMALASEGVQPYDRKGSPWRSGETFRGAAA